MNNCKSATLYCSSGSAIRDELTDDGCVCGAGRNICQPSGALSKWLRQAGEGECPGAHETTQEGERQAEMETVLDTETEDGNSAHLTPPE